MKSFMWNRKEEMQEGSGDSNDEGSTSRKSSQSRSTLPKESSIASDPSTELSITGRSPSSKDSSFDIGSSGDSSQSQDSSFKESSPEHEPKRKGHK